jgi:hypothetical protein
MDSSAVWAGFRMTGVNRCSLVARNVILSESEGSRIQWVRRAKMDSSAGRCGFRMTGVKRCSLYCVTTKTGFSGMQFDNG